MLRVDVGSGPVRREGWVTIDKYCPEANIQAPADNLPYVDGTVDEIMTSHMVEHLLPTELDSALKEWRRVLKVGGKLTVRCPNFPRYVEDWLNGGEEYRWGLGLAWLLGWQHMGPGYWTHNGFSVNRLAGIVEAAGFTVVNATTLRTRTKKGPEYRPDGDLLVEGVKS